jgi:hypothetical protein
VGHVGVYQAPDVFSSEAQALDGVKGKTGWSAPSCLGRSAGPHPSCDVSFEVSGACAREGRGEASPSDCIHLLFLYSVQLHLALL